MGRSNDKMLFNVTLPVNKIKKQDVYYDLTSKTRHLDLIWDIVSHSNDRDLNVAESFGDGVAKEIYECMAGLEDKPHYLMECRALDKGVLEIGTKKGTVIIRNKVGHPSNRVSVNKK